MSLKLHIKILLNCVLFSRFSINPHVTYHVGFHLLQSKRSYVHFFTLCVPHAKKVVIVFRSPLYYVIDT